MPAKNLYLHVTTYASFNMSAWFRTFPVFRLSAYWKFFHSLIFGICLCTFCILFWRRLSEKIECSNEQNSMSNLSSWTMRNGRNVYVHFRNYASCLIGLMWMSYIYTPVEVDINYTNLRFTHTFVSSSYCGINAM